MAQTIPPPLIPNKPPHARAWLAAALVAVLSAAAWHFQHRHAQAPQGQDAAPTVTVELGDIEENVTSQGKLEPKEYVDVGAQVTGQLQKLHVEIGDQVKAGQLLAEIDPRIYAARVQADEARIENLQAQLLEQEAQILFTGRLYRRNQDLIRTKAVSLQALQDSETNHKVANARAAAIKAQMKEVQSTLAGDRTNLGYTKIYAPMDGTVVSQSARAGQTLNANQQTPMIMQLAKLDVMTVRAQTAEADIMRIKPGMPVYFSTLGSEQRHWHGIVRQLLPTPETLNNVVLFNVLVDVDNADRQLMSGMSAQVFFVLGRAERVPLLPTNALGKRLPEQDNAQGLAYRVQLLEGEELRDRAVHVGLQTRRFVQVRDGLAVGDRVKAAPPPEKKNSAARGGYPNIPRL